MKYLKHVFTAFILVCFLVTNVTNVFACPAKMIEQSVDMHKKMDDHCHSDKDETKHHEEDCKTCECSHCNQIPLSNLIKKSTVNNISQAVLNAEKSIKDFSLALTSPPPKLS